MTHERSNPNRLSDRLMVVLATIIGANIGMTLIHSVGVATTARSIDTERSLAHQMMDTPVPTSPAYTRDRND
jgi:hypothetical protein